MKQNYYGPASFEEGPLLLEALRFNIHPVIMKTKVVANNFPCIDLRFADEAYMTCPVFCT